MALFRLNHRARPTETDETEQHTPAFQFGRRLALYLTRLEHRLASILNHSQHRIGFKARNALLVVLGTFFLLYFIALLTQ